MAARLRDEAERRIEKREKEIYQTLHEARLRKENEAATEEQQQRQLWEEQGIFIFIFIIFVFL